MDAIENMENQKSIFTEELSQLLANFNKNTGAYIKSVNIMNHFSLGKYDRSRVWELTIKA